MPSPKCLYLVILATFALANLVLVVTAIDLRALHKSLEARYSQAHSLDDGYEFDPRDGWQTVNASSLYSRYTRDLLEDEDHHRNASFSQTLERRRNKKIHKPQAKEL